MEPTVGRIVHYFPFINDREARSNGNNGPIPAIVTRVWTAGVVNLTCFPDYSAPIARSSVARRKSSDATNAWDWPPRT